jgi:hypothetical protein
VLPVTPWAIAGANLKTSFEKSKKMIKKISQIPFLYFQIRDQKWF